MGPPRFPAFLSSHLLPLTSYLLPFSPPSHSFALCFDLYLCKKRFKGGRGRLNQVMPFPPPSPLFLSLSPPSSLSLPLFLSIFTRTVSYTLPTLTSNLAPLLPITALRRSSIQPHLVHSQRSISLTDSCLETLCSYL